MGFKFTSNEEDEKIFYSWIHDSADGLGFLFDFPVYASYTTAPEEISQYPSSVSGDSKIDFNFIEHTLEYSEVAGHYVDIDNSKPVSFSPLQIINIISKLRDNKLISGAISHYLKSIEEPEFFLTSLYKSYELIRNTGSFSKQDATKFARLANDVSVINSRHTSKKPSDIRYLSKDERNYCKELIRNGIIKLAGGI